MNDQLTQARATWHEAKLRADEAQEVARVAADVACQRFAEYAEIEQPGFSALFRRILKRQPPISNQNITEGKN